MTDLVRPDVRFHDGWAATLDDFGDGHVDGSGSWQFDRPIGTSRAECEEVAAALRAVDVDDPVRPAHLSGDRPWVRCTFLWVTDGEPGSGEGEMIGFLALRHDVPGWLFDDGGHIGYSIRPARRREGHAGRALGLSLGWASDLGLARVLLTCAPDNHASRRTIETNGGVLDEQRGQNLRFWVPTG